jgi:nucleosome binding factor SPN SPT16 subunit
LHTLPLGASGEIFSNTDLQFWLLGYEFPTTLFVITQEKCYIVTTPKKGLFLRSGLVRLFQYVVADQLMTSRGRTAKHLEALKGGKVPLEILVRGKDEAQNTQILKDMADVIKKSGVRFQFPPPS